MPLTVHASELYAALWTLLLARTGFADRVKPGNRIRLDGGKADPVKQAKLDGDLPQALLEQPSMTDSGWATTPTFAHQDHTRAAAQQAAIVELSFVFTLTITHRDLDQASALALVAEAVAAVRNGGPKLGKAYVTRVGPFAHRFANDVEVDKKKRLVSKLTIPVAARVQASALL
jgi:hypothetical protein